MAALQTPDVNLGWKAAPFSLKSVNDLTYTLDDVRGPKGLVVMFICNHCPYVKAVIERVAQDMAALEGRGIGCAAIMSNDTEAYPQDSFEQMKQFAREHHFRFPYLFDGTQEVARAYGAVCTPDFFGFNAKLELQYRGRLDASWQLAVPNPKRELLLAMTEVAERGRTDVPQSPSLGCSIKWKAA
jgi:peroxiredoxin